MDVDKARDAPPDTSNDVRRQALLMTVRSALIMVLGALEDYLRIPRSIPPRSSPRYRRDVVMT